MPRVAVIVPVLNRADYLADCLASVLAQTHGDLDVVVVDDGSTDGSQDVARGFVRADDRVRLVTGPHRGLTRSRQLGVAVAGDEVSLLAHMDSDDVWLEHALTTLMSGLRAGDVGTSGLARLIDATGQPIPGDTFAEFLRDRRGVTGSRYTDRAPHEPTTFVDQIHLSRLYPAGILLLRRDAYMRSLGHDPRFSMGEDWDLSLRLLRQGPLSFVDEVVLLYRQHGANMSHNGAAVVSCSRRIWASTYYDGSLDPAQHEAVRSGWRLLMADRSGEKMAAAREMVRARELPRAAALAGDALAQRLLIRPPRRWAVPPLTPAMVRAQLDEDRAACSVEGRP